MPRLTSQRVAEADKLLNQRELEPQLIPVLVGLNPLVLETGSQPRLHRAEGPLDIRFRCTDGDAPTRVCRLVEHALVVAADRALVGRDIKVCLQRRGKGMDGQKAQQLSAMRASPR